MDKDQLEAIFAANKRDPKEIAEETARLNKINAEIALNNWVEGRIEYLPSQVERAALAGEDYIGVYHPNFDIKWNFIGGEGDNPCKTLVVEYGPEINWGERLINMVEIERCRRLIAALVNLGLVPFLHAKLERKRIWSDGCYTGDWCWKISRYTLEIQIGMGGYASGRVVPYFREDTGTVTIYVSWDHSW
jgi:hypothetical protein